MFEKMESFRMARALIAHATERQAVIARNVANADTPEYKARDLGAFTELYDAPGSISMRATRTAHLRDAGWQRGGRITFDDAQASPNGNSVTLEDEMLKQAEARRQHTLGLTVYRSSLTMMRSALGSN